MLAFAVDQQRIALHLKIHIFAHPHKVINSIIMNLRYTSAFTASNLHVYLLSGDHFILRCALTSLPADGM